MLRAGGVDALTAPTTAQTRPSGSPHPARVEALWAAHAFCEESVRARFCTRSKQSACTTFFAITLQPYLALPCRRACGEADLTPSSAYASPNAQEAASTLRAVHSASKHRLYSCRVKGILSERASTNAGACRMCWTRSRLEHSRVLAITNT
eukprot:226905-Pleurochrysis_carterae.AAC.3